MNRSIPLRARFRGALLGLWLAPTAVAVRPPACSVSELSASETEQMPHQMAQWLEFGFEWIARYSLDPVVCQPPLSSVLGDRRRLMPCWLASVPILLRYHDSRVCRSRWLASQAVPLKAMAELNGESWAAVRGKIELLGDCIEMALCAEGTPLLSYLTELSTDSHGQNDLVEGFLRALAMPYSYGLSVQRAAQTFGQRHGPMPEQVFAHTAGDLVLMTGLVLGALVGEAELPVLWQLAAGAEGYVFEGHASGLDRTEIVDIAERLFGQWAGVSSAVVTQPGVPRAEKAALPATTGRVSDLSAIRNLRTIMTE